MRRGRENDDDEEAQVGEETPSEFSDDDEDLEEESPQAKAREWKSVWDPSQKRYYYYDVETRETTWNKPAEFEDEKEEVKVSAPVQRRERRRTQKLVNYYAKENELDAELEDSDLEEEDKMKRPSHRVKKDGRGRPPKESTIQKQQLNDLDFSLFEEETEADGDRIVDQIIARRPCRNGDAGGALGAILAPCQEERCAFEYLIKFKGVSSVHAEWLSFERISQMGKRSRSKLASYNQKKYDEYDEYGVIDDSYEPPIFTIERVLDVRVTEKPVDELTNNDDQDKEDPIDHDDEEEEEEGEADEESQEETDMRKDEHDDVSPSSEPKDSAPPIVEPVQFKEEETTLRRTRKRAATGTTKQVPRHYERWRPMARCLHLVKKLCNMPEAEPFLDKVDTDAIPDYLDFVAKPMHLNYIIERLHLDKYSDVDSVYRDVKLVWSNCKAYNLPGSSIWRAAVVLGMATDRLFDAWIWEAEDDSITSANANAGPLAPWTSGCRGCRAPTQDDDDSIVLCDHCDAEYHRDCRFHQTCRRVVHSLLSQRVDDAPAKLRLIERVVSAPLSDNATWHCAICLARSILSGTRGLLSARVEDEYRKTVRQAFRAERRSELRDTPAPVKIHLEFLVKWTGLSYKSCSWESHKTILTRDDVTGGKHHIALFQLNNYDAVDQAIKQIADMKAKLNDCIPPDLSIMPAIIRPPVIPMQVIMATAAQLSSVAQKLATKSETPAVEAATPDGVATVAPVKELFATELKSTEASPHNALPAEHEKEQSSIQSNEVAAITADPPSAASENIDATKTDLFGAELKTVESTVPEQKASTDVNGITTTDQEQKQEALASNDIELEEKINLAEAEKDADSTPAGMDPVPSEQNIVSTVPLSVTDASGALRPDPSRKLRTYQERGVAWMLDCREKERGCILADEMGLGKTAQICAYIWRMCRRRESDKPCLIVAPLSTIGHWEREFRSWTPLEVCMYHDTGRDARDLRRHYEWWPMVNGVPCPDVNHDKTKFHVLVTTYDELIRDADQLETISWAACIVDEAHRLKNERGRLIESLNAVLSLGTKQRPYQHRVLLTGTPLQNDTKELWTLMNFIEHDEGFFGRGEARVAYDENFGKMETAEQVRELQQAIAPHLLRRVKEDVAQDIPVKRETIIDVELTFAQKRYYRALYEKNISALAALQRSSAEGTDASNEALSASTSTNLGSLGSAMPSMNNLQMELRKCCNHPLLLRGVRESELEKLQDELLQEHDDEIIENATFKREIGNRLIVPQAGKMVLLDKLLPKLQREGHKVLIFSQMVKMLSILSEYCQHRAYPYEVLDGRVRGDERQRSIDRFNDPEANSFIMLLSTRAGGVGINLVAADTVVIYDSDWNPQNDVQAMARCHRLGQTKDVMVYRLVARRTFEGQMFDRASRKLGLERAVLAGDLFSSQGGGSGSSALAMKKPVGPTAAELENLLRRGAYGLIEAEGEADSRAQAFCEADIDEILQERATVRVMEGEETASWLNKSSFAVEDNKSDLNVNDPRFWEKAMPDMKTPELLLARLDRGFFKATQDVTTKKEDTKTAMDESDDHPEQTGENVSPKKSTKKSPKKSAVDKDDAKDADSSKDDDEEEPDEDETDVEIDEEIKDAFWDDLTTLIKNAIKHRQKGVLSERERQSTMRLLLRISVDSRAFNTKEMFQANTWYKKLEGTRRRVTSQQQTREELDYDDEDTNNVRRGRRNRDEDFSFEEDNADDDDDELDENVIDENGARQRRRRRRKGPPPPKGRGAPSGRQARPQDNGELRKNPRRKNRAKGIEKLDADDDEFLEMADDDPRNLLWRIEYNGRTKKEKAIVGPPLPEAPPPELTKDLIGEIMKYGEEHFYISCNNDTINVICELLGDKVSAGELVKLNRRRFPGLSRSARLMPHTCIILPQSFKADDAAAFNTSSKGIHTEATNRPELRIIIKNPKFNKESKRTRSSMRSSIIQKTPPSYNEDTSFDEDESVEDTKRPRRSAKRVKYGA